MRYLSGVGEKRAALYEKLGIATAEELLRYFPRDYIDYNKPVKISELELNEYAVVRARVVAKPRPYIGHVSVYKVIIDDDSERILCVFFNTPYTYEKLVLGKEYLFYGKAEGNYLEKQLTSPTFIEADAENKLTPKYRLTAGLTLGVVTSNIKMAIKNCSPEDELPERIRREYGLIGYAEAISKIHFPSDEADYRMARERLAFEELLTLQLGLKILRAGKSAKSGAMMKPSDISELFEKLPFKPTNAQLRAISECKADMISGQPMSRLLQGDVGSGKTLVAAALCFFSTKNGFQSTLMAPTEVLANQHYETLCGFLTPLGVKVALLTGSMSAAEKKALREKIKSGEAEVIVGTQALIQKNVVFSRLGLVITDEQHRFGVNQRSVLTGKGKNPHTLFMSATPIPRTLALIIYGDLDISLLDEMPRGRLPIKTYGVNSSYRARIYNFIKKHIADGFQAYIVCPMIEEGTSDKASVEAYYDSLKGGAFADISVGCLHGRMKQAEKDAVMTAFKKNEISVLVSTTVIEVGIDVPSAVVILIENAEQYGLSQLHQLRGRVGRGQTQSYCILITDNDSEYTRARVDTMVKSSDGFEIANEDLRLRGPGDFFGSRQHGLPELKIADVSADLSLINRTKELSERIIAEDSGLCSAENAGLLHAVKQLFSSESFSGLN